ncbi:probable endochitinase [Topomyia yanbarensis]|uniref:probable endochitinase n=1 Tax=Topomyia yanbarensis TaxID=2498891 RepID=UPI00273C8ACF|nr:probable endochitinase [Topomyia yanbarensis]
MGYNEFCEKQQSEQWHIHFNEEQKGVFATSGNQWVGYENPETIALKMEYLLNLDLGGAMVWSLESDDFLGVCNDSNYVLMNTIYRSFHNGTEAPAVPTTPATSTTTSNSASATPNECSTEGIFPSPNSCQEYYVCTSDGRRFNFSCPDGLWFDPVFNFCNWPEQVNCDSFETI